MSEREDRRALPIAVDMDFVRSRYSAAGRAAIAEEQSQALAPLVARGPEGAIEAAEKASARAAELGREMLEFDPPSTPIACRAGCSTCCQAKVLAVAPEVLRIADFLRKTRSPEEIAVLLERVREADEKTRGLSRPVRAMAHVPCPLLDAEGACSVHEVRPLVCRSWTSFDARACERYWASPSGQLTPPQWAVGYELTQAVLAGLGKACFDVGRDGSPLELIAALRIALERPSAGERWHKRLPVFSGAKDEEWAAANVKR